MSQSKGFVSTASTLLVTSSLIEIAIGITTSFFVPALADPKSQLFFWSGAVLVIMHVLAFVGILGFWMSRASGRGRLAYTGMVIAALGYLVLTFAEGILRFSFDLGNNLFGIAVPLAGLGFILLGIAVLRTNLWSGWQKWMPLLTGLYIPIVLLPAFALAQGPSFPAITGLSCCRLALGIALAQADQSKVMNSSVKTAQNIALN
jgi:hypothetical protein